MANGTITRWKGGSWPDIFGGHAAGAADYVGPTTYTNPGGDPIPFDSVIGAGTRAHAIVPAVTSDGLYLVLFQPNNSAGVPHTWVARWFLLSTMAEVSNGTDLSGHSAVILAIGK